MIDGFLQTHLYGNNARVPEQKYRDLLKLWNAMMEVKDERLFRFLNDYRNNLISPIDMEDDGFEKFHIDLGLAMKVIKYQKEDADKVIMETDHRKIDRDTAFFLNKTVNLGLEYEEKEGGIDMCASLERKYKEKEVTGAIEGMRLMGASDNDIVSKIVEKFNVTKEYVVSLLTPKTA